MAGEFEIPESSPVDQLESVQESYKPAEVADKVEGVRRCFFEDGPCAIQQCFPIYISLTRYFCDVEETARLTYYITAANALSILCHKLEACHLSQLSSSEKFEMRNSLKMLSYVVVLMTEAYENQALKCEPALGSRRKTKQTSSSLPNNWTSEKVKILSIFTQLAELELWGVCEPASPALMEDWARMVVQMAYKLLENQTIVREKALKEVISTLFHNMVTFYSQGLGVSVKVVQLLQHFEHLPTTLAQLVAALDCKTVVMEIVREIGRKDPHDLAVDSSGTKSYSTFLVDLCHECPSDVLACVSVLLPHLNGESYTFRNGVLGVIGELLGHLTAMPTLDEQSKILRDQLFGKLEEHIHDSNAFVRIKVLHILQQLVTTQAIPLPRVEPLVSLVTGRLRDKSSSVRKNALQLLTTIIANNPFAAQLDKSEFLSKLESEEANLEEALAQPEIVSYLRDALKFIIAMETAVELAVLLLRSKVISDVLEALDFLCALHMFNVGGANEGVRRALMLIWSPEDQVRQALVTVYVKLFIDSKGDGQTSSVVNQLMELVQCSSYGELASLHQLVNVLVKKELISPSVIESLISLCHSQNKQKCQQAMQLVAMAATADSSIINRNIQRLVQYGLCTSPPDLLLAKHTCVALQMSDSSRLPPSHPIFSQLHLLLTNQVTNYQESQWIPLAEQAVKLVYKLSNRPENFSTSLLKTLAGTVNESREKVNSLLLSRVLFTAGQVVFSQIHHCEVTLAKQMKNKAMLQHKQQNSKVGGSGSEGGMVDADDMGLTGASAEDLEAELMKHVLENEVVGSSGLLAVFEKMTVLVVSNPSKYSCPGLQATACLTLAKYMLASGKLCEKYLQLFFTVLEKSSLEVVRANAVIAASDLTCRFPNLIEPWTPFIYARLRDSSMAVRRNAITVLTHLILNDMVKVRGHICAMAVCLKDCDLKIVELSQLFFHELAKKGNALYNVLPDIISHLSDSQLDLSQEDVHTVIKYLLALIVKEKQTENLVEKLCHRFRAVRNDNQLQNLVYCLSQLSFTERSVRKLQDNFSCYKDKLVHDEVYGVFVAILARTKKGAKSEFISTIEELEKLFEEAHNKGLQETSSVAAHITEEESPVSSNQQDRESLATNDIAGHVTFNEDVLLSARKSQPVCPMVQTPVSILCADGGQSPFVRRTPLPLSSEDED